MADNDQPIQTGAPTASPGTSDAGAAGHPPQTAPAVIAEAAPAAAPIEQAPAAASAPAAAPVDPALTSPPSLLEEFGKDKDAKPAEAAGDKPVDGAAKPAEGDKPAVEAEKKPDEAAAKPEDKKPDEKKPEPAVETKPPEPVKLEPIEYKYELPETLKLDDALKTDLHGALDAFRAEPTNVQPLIDLHNKVINEFAAATRREQYSVFNDTRAGWRKDVMADPEIGGAGHQTAMGAIARMRDLAVPEKDRPAFDEFLRITGAGDHPAFLRAMHNFARYFDEPAPPPPNPKPSPTNGANPAKAGVRALYTHPTSRDQRP